MQTLQKLNLSNRLYTEQVTCHLLMLLLSARVFLRPQSKTHTVAREPVETVYF